LQFNTPSFFSLTPRFSEVWRSCDFFFNRFNGFSRPDYFLPLHAFTIRKKKLLLQLKEISFDRLTLLHLLSILHSQFSAFAQQ